MIIKNIKYKHPNDSFDIQNEVTVDDLTISVASGSFKSNGNVYNLTQNYDFVVSNRPEYTMLYGYLVDDAGTIELLVDEIVFDGSPEVWYNWSGGEIPLHQIFTAKIPENSNNLDNAELWVYHMIPGPQPLENS